MAGEMNPENEELYERKLRRIRQPTPNPVLPKMATDTEKETVQKLCKSIHARLSYATAGLDWQERLEERSVQGQKLLPCQMEALRLAKQGNRPKVDESETELLAERLAIQSEGSFSEEF